MPRNQPEAKKRLSGVSSRKMNELRKNSESLSLLSMIVFLLQFLLHHRRSSSENEQVLSKKRADSVWIRE